MNRETKIGLLVGLAFIIVIGVLLSDHIQTSTQTRPAMLNAVGDVVRGGTAAPGTENPGARKVIPPTEITPQGQVATNDLLDNQAQPIADIHIGPADRSTGVAMVPSSNGGSPIVVGPGSEPGVIIPASSSTNLSGGSNLVTPTGNEPMPAKTQFVDGVVPNTVDTGKQTAQAGAINPPRTHTAASGDSVYKLAVKYYGGYTKAREQMIVQANPALAKGGKIVIGQKYVIPNLPGSPAAPAVADSTQVAPAPQPVTPVQPKAPAAQTPKPSKAVASTYQVKSGDSLAKIASKNGVSVAALRSANKDLLKGSDTLQIGMTLKLPEKAVASAN